MDKETYFLNFDHPALKKFPERAQVVFQRVLRQALQHTATYRIQFERTGLQAALGKGGLETVMPHLPPARSRPGSLLRRSEVHEEAFHPAKTEVLLNLLSFELEGRPDLALNYLSAVELLDPAGELVLGAYDQVTSLCFRLPEEAKEKLLGALRQSGIPVDIVERVELGENSIEDEATSPIKP